MHERASMLCYTDIACLVIIAKPFQNKKTNTGIFRVNDMRLSISYGEPQWLLSFKCYHTVWRTKCHTIDCARNTFLLLQKHLISGTELILISWKIVPNEEHIQCDHRFASQPLANEPLHSSQLFDTSLQKARGTTSLCGP